METEKLYYSDPTARCFTARVLSCRETPRGWEIILDKTAFYPEGGGQSWDLGTLGGTEILSVTERGEEIIHLCSAPLPVGEAVSGEIDWPRRRENCQQHSGEHIFSGLVARRFGYHNVGFHMGKAAMQIDFDGPICPEAIRELEWEANEAVWADVPLHIFYPEPEELARLPYRSKKALTGKVRLVEIPGYDLCACCGTHVQRTGEIGPIKVLSCVKFHSGVRLELICGAKALQYLNGVFTENRAVSQALSVPPLETGEAAQRLLKEMDNLKYRLVALENESIARQAKALKNTGNQLLFRDGLTADSLQRLACAVGETCGGICAVFSGTSGSFRYAIAGNEDVRPFTTALNKAFEGRGGGKPNLTQGSLTGSQAALEAFWEAQNT